LTDAGGPPGSAVFSLEKRPGAGLYLLAWLLTGAGIAVTFVGLQAEPGVPRLLILGGLVLLALGLATAAGYQILARRATREAQAYRGPSPLILFLLVIVVVNAVGGLLALTTNIGNGLDVDAPGVFLFGLLIQVAAYIGAIWFFVLAPRALTWADIVNRSGTSVASALGDIANAVGVTVPVTVVTLILGSLVALLLKATPPQVLPIPTNGLEIAIDAIAAIVLAPIGEELFFRGFAQTAWSRDLGARAGLIRAAVFFALVHILNVRVDSGGFDAGLRSAIVELAVLLPVGLMLGYLFQRRGLIASTAAHMTYNGIVFGLLLLSTLLPPPPA
jgi:membrane protease YdiL (CAAX protease family)